MKKATEQNPLTWADMKEFVNSLTEDQLKVKIMWLGEERGGAVTSLETFSKDQINPSGEGFEPISAYTGENEDKDFPVDDEPIVWHKGDPAMWSL